MSVIAEHAGVRRSTVYRHFPDEEALFAACSSHWAGANPSPDAGAWVAIADPVTRNETALRELYPYYRRTRHAYEHLLRDEELVPVVKRLMTSYHEYLRSVQDLLMVGRGLRGHAARRTRAAIGLARVPDLAHAYARAGTRRRRGCCADVSARRRLGQPAILRGAPTCGPVSRREPRPRVGPIARRRLARRNLRAPALRRGGCRPVARRAGER